MAQAPTLRVDASTPVLAEIIDAAGKNFTGAIEMTARGGETPRELTIYLTDGEVYAVTAPTWVPPVLEWATWQTKAPIPEGAAHPDEYAYQTRAVDAAEVNDARRDWAYGLLAAATTWVKPRFKRRRKKETLEGRFTPVQWQRLVTDIGDRVAGDQRAWRTICGALKANGIPVKVAEQASPILTVKLEGDRMFTGELSLDQTARKAGITRSRVLNLLAQEILAGGSPVFGKAPASGEVLVPELLQESAEAAEVARLEALFAAPAHGEGLTPKWRPVSGASAVSAPSAPSPAAVVSPVSAPSPEEALDEVEQLEPEPEPELPEPEPEPAVEVVAEVIDEPAPAPAPPVPVDVTAHAEGVVAQDARGLLNSFVSFARNSDDQDVRRSIVERVLASALEEVEAVRAESDRTSAAMYEADTAVRAASAQEQAAHTELTTVREREQERQQAFQQAMEYYQVKVSEGQTLQTQQEEALASSAAEQERLDELLALVEDARMRVDAANRAVDLTVEQLEAHQQEMTSQVRPAVDSARGELDTFRSEVLTPAQQSFTTAQQQRAAAQAQLEAARVAAEQARTRLAHAQAVADSLAAQ